MENKNLLSPLKRHVGDHLCVRDCKGVWCLGVITGIYPKAQKIGIHFVGFDDKYDEIVDNEGPHIQTEPLENLLHATLTRDFQSDQRQQKIDACVSLVMHLILQRAGWQANIRSHISPSWTKDLSLSDYVTINAELAKRCRNLPYLFGLFPDSKAGVQMCTEWQRHHFACSVWTWLHEDRNAVLHCLRNPAFLVQLPPPSYNAPLPSAPPPDYVPEKM
jgi:hypothetical protein